MNTIVLAAGKIDHSNIIRSGISSYGMMPVRGKPFILWCIESVEKNIIGTKIVVVVRSTNLKLIRYLESLISQGKNLQLSIFDDNTAPVDNILVSVLCGLRMCDLSTPTQIVLGDTMIRESFPEKTDVVLSSKAVKSSAAWCLIKKDARDRVIKYFDKQNGLNFSDKEALIGYYKLNDSKFFKYAVEKALGNNQAEISCALEIYQQKYKIIAQPTDNWLDFGHIASVVKANHKLFNAREFNRLEIDDIKGIITKTSHNKQKLRDEANWYANLPDELKILTPRVLATNENENTFSLKMELLGYPNLAEVFVYGDSSFEDLAYMLDKLFAIQQIFSSYNVNPNPVELNAIYNLKTNARVSKLFKSDIFKHILAYDYIIINGKAYKNYSVMVDALNYEIKRLVDYDGDFCITHGDYCFSNILFDSMNFTFRLIDPRGRFLNNSIYGDPRYDVAKLRHSAVGLYDFIVLGFYKLRQINDSEFEFEILADACKLLIQPYFDALVSKYDFALHQIKVIEALLFLTMIPFHNDDSERQKAFYLTAIIKLNELLYEK